MKNQTLPNLIGCGAGKSGTTSLYYYLRQHPEIDMAPMKEVHYFSQYYDRGIEWYLSQFDHCEPVKIRGEFSTSYMLDPLVPQRIAEVVPEAKLLFVLRNPIDRAYSNYWSSIGRGSFDASVQFSEAIRKKSGQEAFVIPGFYYQHIRRFLEFFDRRQLYLMISEELQTDQLSQLSKCYEFLGVDPSFIPDATEMYNITVISPNEFFFRIDQTWLKAKDTLRKLFSWVPEGARRKFAQVEQRIRWGIISGDKPLMDIEDRKYLRDIYQEHNRNLAQFLERDLPWI